jgi:hypothetical protein
VYLSFHGYDDVTCVFRFGMDEELCGKIQFERSAYLKFENGSNIADYRSYIPVDSLCRIDNSHFLQDFNAKYSERTIHDFPQKKKLNHYVFFPLNWGIVDVFAYGLIFSEIREEEFLEIVGRPSHS